MFHFPEKSSEESLSVNEIIKNRLQLNEIKVQCKHSIGKMATGKIRPLTIKCNNYTDKLLKFQNARKSSKTLC